MSLFQSSAALPTDPVPSPAPAGTPIATPSPGAAWRGWQCFFVWSCGSMLAALATAWLAFQIRLSGHAPELLFPIGVGLVLGFALAAVIHYTGWPARRTAIAATMVWGLAVVLGQEYFAHLDHRRNYFDVQNRPNLSAFARLAAGEMPPPDFAADLGIDIRERGVWPWSFDALACLLSAAIVVAFRVRSTPIAANASCATTPPAATFSAANGPTPAD